MSEMEPSGGDGGYDAAETSAPDSPAADISPEVRLEETIVVPNKEGKGIAKYLRSFQRSSQGRLRGEEHRYDSRLLVGVSTISKPGSPERRRIENQKRSALYQTYLVDEYVKALESGHPIDPRELINFLALRTEHKFRQAIGLDPNVHGKARLKSVDEWREVETWRTLLDGMRAGMIRAKDIKGIKKFANWNAEKIKKDPDFLRGMYSHNSRQTLFCVNGFIVRPDQFEDYYNNSNSPYAQKEAKGEQSQQPPIRQQAQAEQPPAPEFEEGARVTWVDENGVEHSGVVRKKSPEK